MEAPQRSSDELGEPERSGGAPPAERPRFLTRKAPPKPLDADSARATNWESSRRRTPVGLPVRLRPYCAGRGSIPLICQPGGTDGRANSMDWRPSRGRRKVGGLRGSGEDRGVGTGGSSAPADAGPSRDDHRYPPKRPPRSRGSSSSPQRVRRALDGRRGFHRRGVGLPRTVDSPRASQPAGGLRAARSQPARTGQLATPVQGD